MKFSLIALAIVFPTLNSPIKYLDIKKATKLKNAAHKTAWKGVKTFVDTMVAMELAESWNPFIQSKTKAKTMIMISKGGISIKLDKSESLRVFH